MDSIEKIHKINLNLLKEVDRICSKNNLDYFLESGTLLGAVRHHGFIPWDDDIDILIKREQLQSFLDACKRDLDEKYELIMPNDFNHHFFDFVPRIIVKDSQLRNTTPEDLFYGNMQNKIALDIFILDSASSNKLLQKTHVLKHKIIYGLAMGHRYKMDYSKYSFCNKIFSGTLAAVGKYIALDKILKWQENTAIKYNNKNSNCCMVSNYILKEIGYVFEKKWYQNTEKLQFEDCKLNCPTGWDFILTVLYGNYMTPPKETERIYTHMKDKELKVSMEGK